jgi:hypothetical protein
MSPADMERQSKKSPKHGGNVKHILALCFVLFVVNAFALADIQVTYTGFTTDQQAAFESAISLWENVLCSEVPIKINVTLQNVPGFVVVFVPNLIRNFAGTPHQISGTAIALPMPSRGGAESRRGGYRSHRESQPALVLWAGWTVPCFKFGFCYRDEKSDSLWPGLYAILLCAIRDGHLWPSGSQRPGLTTSFPWESMQGAPVLYDTFVCNTSGQYLTDTTQFTNVSAALNTQLTGGNLRYNGPYGVEFAGGTQPVLYASAFNLARTARLFADTYLGTENEPGIPTAYNGSVLRHISPIVLGILIDQG